jgi:hypothetical protein
MIRRRKDAQVVVARKSVVSAYGFSSLLVLPGAWFAGG